MSPESFKSHNVFQKLEQLKEVIKMKNAKEIISLDDLDFFDTFYHYIIGKLKLTIPILIQSPEIDGLSSEIEAGTGQINTYLVNKNTGHINNAKNNFISALTRIKNLPFPYSKNDFNFSKEISDFQFNVKEKYDQLTEINKKIDVDLKTTQDDLISKQNQIFDLEKKLSEKETEIQNVLSKYNSEFETFKITGNTNLESDRKKFSNIFEEDRKQFKEQFESDKENFKKIFDETTVSTKDEYDNASEVLNSKLEEAKKIVNIIGNIGVTGNYQKIANENGKAANIWRMISMTFMIIMSILVIWSIYELSVAQYDVYKSLVRILAAAVLTYPAIYASRESSKHRNLETRNRTLELELASIGPFIEILPEETKQKIKEDLVNKFFGKRDFEVLDNNKENESMPISLVERVLKAIEPLLRK